MTLETVHERVAIVFERLFTAPERDTRVAFVVSSDPERALTVLVRVERDPDIVFIALERFETVPERDTRVVFVDARFPERVEIFAFIPAIVPERAF